VVSGLKESAVSCMWAWDQAIKSKIEIRLLMEFDEVRVSLKFEEYWFYKLGSLKQ